MKPVASDIYGDEHDVSKADLSWRPSVYGILMHQNKILLSPQFESGRYVLPGGGVEIDESFEEAVEREVKEETGLSVTVGKQVAIHQNFFRSSHDKEPSCYHAILIFYECTYLSGEISVDYFDNDEKQYMKKAEWVDIDTLDSIDVASTFDWREVVKEYTCRES